MVIIIIVFKVSFLFHIEVRILESPGLEKAFKTTKFSHRELLSSITKPRPLVSCLHVTNTSRDERYLLEIPFQCLVTLSMKKSFLNTI